MSAGGVRPATAKAGALGAVGAAGGSYRRPREAAEGPGQGGAGHGELAADAVGGLGLGVEGLELAGGAPEEEQDARVGAGSALRVRGMGAQQLREGQAGGPQGAGAEQFAARRRGGG